MTNRIYRAADGMEAGSAPTSRVTAPVKISARDVSVFYGDKQALFDVNLDIQDKTVTALPHHTRKPLRPP